LIQLIVQTVAKSSSRCL